MTASTAPSIDANAQTAADMRAIVSGRPDLEALSITRLSANPIYNAQLRTTCVATQIQGGHAINALPQRASATINCRVLPGEPISEVHETLKRVLADDAISVMPFGGPVLSTPSPLHQEIMGAIEKLTAEFWPGIPVIPICAPPLPIARICVTPGFSPTAIPA